MKRRTFLNAGAATAVSSILTGGVSFNPETLDNEVNAYSPKLLENLPYSDKTPLTSSFGAKRFDTLEINGRDTTFLGTAILQIEDEESPALTNIHALSDEEIILHNFSNKRMYHLITPRSINPYEIDDNQANERSKVWSTYSTISRGLKAVSKCGINLASYIPSNMPNREIQRKKHFPQEQFVHSIDEFIDKYKKREHPSYYLITEEGFILDLGHTVQYAWQYDKTLQAMEQNKPVALSTTVDSAPIVFDIDYENLNSSQLQNVALAIQIHHAYMAEFVQDAGNKAWRNIPQVLGRSSALSCEDMFSNFTGVNALISLINDGITNPSIEDIATKVGEYYKASNELNSKDIPSHQPMGIYPHLPVVLFKGQKPINLDLIKRQTAITNDLLQETSGLVSVAETNPYRSVYNKAFGI